MMQSPSVDLYRRKLERDNERLYAMLTKLVNGWQSNMTASEAYDSLVWDARMLLDDTIRSS